METFTDGEVEFLDDLLADVADKMRHHPGEFEDWQEEAHIDLWNRVQVEMRRRRFS